MLPDRVSNPGPLTYESGALPISLRGPIKKIAGFHENEPGAVCMSDYLTGRKPHFPHVELFIHVKYLLTGLGI